MGRVKDKGLMTDKKTRKRKANQKWYLSGGKEKQDIYRKTPIQKSRRKEYMDTYQFTLSGRYSRAKAGAKSRGLIFTIDKDEYDYTTKKPCFYCGETSKIRGLDRIDSNEGYYTENVLPCCWTCNIMKHVMPLEEFYIRVLKIASYIRFNIEKTINV